MGNMEITIVSQESIRIKGKQTAFVVDPVVTKAKVTADAVLLAKGSSVDTSSVEGSRLTIAGPGEYEIGGVKISGVKSGETTAYYLSLDGVSVLISPTSMLKNKESLRDVDVVVLQADSVVDQSALATVANGVALFYGVQAAENIKGLGKELQSVSKYVTTKDKLPQEMEIVLLG